MEYIVYVSTAVTLMSEKDLADLLKISRDKNKKCDITGILLYCQGTFMQVLEGEKKNIDLIYKAIELDTRHKNIIKLSTGIITKRNFPGWFMAFASVNTETLKDMEGFLSISSANSPGNPNHITVNMLKAFADSNKFYISV